MGYKIIIILGNYFRSTTNFAAIFFIDCRLVIYKLWMARNCSTFRTSDFFPIWIQIIWIFCLNKNWYITKRFFYQMKKIKSEQKKNIHMILFQIRKKIRCSERACNEFSRSTTTIMMNIIFDGKNIYWMDNFFFKGYISHTRCEVQ